MFKKTHIKTIMIFFIIGLIFITGFGILNILNLNDIKGIDKFSYYSNVILLYFIINLIFIYIGNLLINKTVKK